MATTPTLTLQSLFNSVDKMVGTVTSSFSKPVKKTTSSSGLKLMKSIDKELKNPSSAINGALAKGMETPLTRGFSTVAYTLKYSLKSYTTRISSVLSGAVRTVFGKLVDDLSPLIESFKATMEFVRNTVLLPIKSAFMNMFSKSLETVSSIYTYLKERFRKNPVLVEMKKEFTLQNKQRKLFKQKKWWLRKIEWNTRNLNENTILSHINFVSDFKRGVERKKNVKLARQFNVDSVVDTVSDVASAGVGIFSTVTKVAGSILGGVNNLFQGLGSIIGMFGVPGRIIGTVIKVLPFVLGLVLFKGLWTMFKETPISTWLNKHVFIPFGKWFDKNKSEIYEMGIKIGKELYNAITNPSEYDVKQTEKEIAELENLQLETPKGEVTDEQRRKLAKSRSNLEYEKKWKKERLRGLKLESGAEKTAFNWKWSDLTFTTPKLVTKATLFAIGKITGKSIGKKADEKLLQDNDSTRRYQDGGTSNKKVHSLVMPGEYIVENAAEKYGEDFINDINKGIIKKYKSGGLVLPGVSNVVTSNFGPRRTGLKGASTYHKGIDLRAPMGSPIKAIQNGTVTGINNTWGKVSIRHSDGSTSSYLHLSSIGVNKGENIQQGQRIGAAGKTGPIPGMSPHLHLSLQSPNGAYLNPLDVLMANGVPLQQKNGNVPSTDTMYAQTDTSGANTPSAFGPSTSSTGLSISDMFKNAVFSSAELSGTTKNSDITSLESAKSILNGEIDKRLKENRLKIAQNRKKNNNVSIASVSGDNNQSIVSNPVPIFKTAFGV